MLDAGREAVSFLSGRDQTELETDRMLLLSVVKSIEILGEAASKVSEETRDLAPHIPWQDIVRMRNRLVHGYFDIDTHIVWSTVFEEVPPWVTHLEGFLLNTP